MQDLKVNALNDNKQNESKFTLLNIAKNLRKFVLPWIIVSVIIAVFIGGIYIFDSYSNLTVSVNVNFSFDGVESGNDPNGNDFDVNEIKSKSAIESTLEELGIDNVDPKSIYKKISISGNVPSNVIERIITYTSKYDGEDSVTSEEIADTTYYPTQYTITMDCSDLDLSYKECVNVLNTLTTKYYQSFSKKYGYMESLANAVKSFDYNDYDYSDAISIFDSSLESLQDYINELAKKDTVRFRSEKTGYTFSDLEKSIGTIRNENLDIISSYITLYNMTKDKANLIADYEFRVEDLKRQKTVSEEKLEAIKKTLEVYEKNAIMIFAEATSGADATLNKSTDTYNNLIEMQVSSETDISNYQQQIDKYNQRIKKLKENGKTGSAEKLEEDFANINEKINTLLSAIETTVKEYYEENIYVNAYQVLAPASSSHVSVIVSSLKNSFYAIVAVELIAASVYIIIACIAVYVNIPCPFKSKKGKTENKDKKNTKKSKGGRK